MPSIDVMLQSLTTDNFLISLYEAVWKVTKVEIKSNNSNWLLNCFKLVQIAQRAKRTNTEKP